MEIAKTYDPAPVEDKWYAYWLKHKHFAARPNPDKEPYCIVIPPPNVTGVLHMGHMLNNTIQDILVRRARMQGREACWVPGTDHASIATEAKVVAMLREKGIAKEDIGREKFLEHAWEWKEKYGGVILNQLQKLGASCDWDRTRFTMEPALSESVIDVFVDLYNKGLVYRAYRMVNWDPKGRTALSDEEVVYKEVPSRLFFIKYPVVIRLTQIVFETGLTDSISDGELINLNDTYAFLDKKKVKFSDLEVFDINGQLIKLKDLGLKFSQNKTIALGELQFKAYKPTEKFVDFLISINRERYGESIPTEFSKDLMVYANHNLTIATTRPETILADTAICVNPADERYKHLVGGRVRVPFTNRDIPVIADEYVTMDFGTGALKVTPAHDLNDYELGKRHGLPVIDILHDDGTLNERCGVPAYVGQDRFAVRKRIAKDLAEAGFLEKTEDYRSNVGYSERNPDTVVEPKISMQWWLKMDGLARPALENVLNDTVRFHPARFKNLYRAWMENIRDWCISRQLWWGHRIPAWYDGQGNHVVARNHEEALALYKTQHPESDIRTLAQDEDVLDTWFSAWLWPVSVFDGIRHPDGEDVNYFYPTNDLVTGPDIIFFWVARMIMSGYEYRGREPFRNVYFTGIIRDQYGRKMSKQLGNSPDPLGLIARYGADGVRTGLLFSSPAGNDLIFDTPVPKTNDPAEIARFQQENDVLASSLCEQGSKFNNKVWNAFRLVKSLTPGPSPKERGEKTPAWQTANPLLWEKLKTWGRENRQFATEAEEKLWQKVRNAQLGYKIRRQHSIESLIVDFVCLDKQLVIEIDGEVHNQPEQAEYDKLRTEFLNELGYKVIRFSNDDVFAHIEQVLQTIKNELNERPSYSEFVSPLPGKGVGGEAAPLSLGEGPGVRLLPIEWFEARFNQKLAETEEHFANYDISKALHAVYKLAWDDFCSWYLEMVKPDFGQTLGGDVYRHTVALFDRLLRVLHPFMPFITEEIWQQLEPRADGESICTAPYPAAAPADQTLLDEGAAFQEVVSQVRNVRSSRGLSPKIALPLAIRTAHPAPYHRFGGLIRKLANLSEITFVTDKVPGAAAFLFKSDEFFVVLAQDVDSEAEREKAGRELDYQRGFRDSVLKKLGNERFVANAKPEVVDAERRKLADADAKIKALEERLGSL